MKDKIFLQFKKEELAFLYALVEGNINSINKKSKLSKEEIFVLENLQNLKKKLDTYKKLINVE